MATVARLDVQIGADIKQFQRGMSQMQMQLKKVGSDLQRVGATLSRSVTLPILGVAGAAVKAASDVEEMQAKFNTVFKTVGGSVSKELGNFAKEVNRSRYDLQGFAATFGDIIKPMGFTEESAADMSVTLTKLAVDLSSFNNMPMDEAVRRLRGTLIGAHENAAEFGVIINENTLKQELMRMGADKLEGAQKEQAKTQARLNLLLKGTTDAQGDAARTSGSFANQMRGLVDATRDLGVDIGTVLMPYAKELVGTMRGLVDRFKNLSPEAKKTALAIAGLVAAIGPALFIFGGMASGLSAIIGSMSALAALANPVVLAFAAVAAIGIAVYRNWDAVKGAFVGTWEAISGLIVNLKDNFITVFAGIFKAAAQAVTGDFSGAFKTLKSTVSTGASNVVTEISTFATDVGAAVAPAAAAMMFDPLKISDLFSSDFVSGVTGGLSQIGSQATKSLSGNTDSVTSSAGEASKELESLVVSTGNVVTGVKGISDEVIKLEKVDPDFSLMEKAMGAEKGSVKAAADAAAESVKGIFSAIPTTLEMPEGYKDVITSVIPDKDESHRWGKFVIGMDDLKEDLRDASHFSFTMSGYLGDIEESWRALFGTDSPKWMKDLSRYATDAGLIVQGLEAMVQLLTPSTWTDAFGVLKDLGGQLGNILGFLIDIVLKIGEWIAAQVGFGDGGGGMTIGGPGTGVPPVTIPGTSTTSAGGGGGLAGLLGGATVGATIGIFGYGLTQMLTDSMQSLLEQGLSEAQVGTAVSLGGLLQGLGSMGSGGTPSWLSGLQGYMGSGGAANTSGFMGGMGGLFGSGSSGSMGQTINVNLDGQTIATATVPYMANELEVFGTNY
jgi:hypothetical protein